MRIAIVAVIFLAGCGSNPPAVPDDAPVSCTESGPGCVCLDMVCVECTVDDERNCGNTRPQCGDDNVCRACRSNDECDSGACLEDGSCANTNQVIYTSPGGVNTAGCGKTQGQDECSLAQALVEVGPPRDVIRLAPGAYSVPMAADGLDFSTKSATLVARGATLTRTAVNGAILSARNNQTLKIVGGTLLGPSNTTDGIRCDGNSKLLVHEVTIDGMIQSGIETNVCQLTVSRSTLRNNKLGGINMTNTASVVTITNNFVYRNGTAASPIGGMGLKLAAGSKVELNTVADNSADTSIQTAAGIVCEGQGYDAPFNLVYRNAGGIGGQVQVFGTCTFQGSYQMGADVGVNEVGFENPAGATPSYRLTPASPPGTIRDAFDCKEIDFERDARPFPADGKCDFGADEFRAGP